MHTEHSAKTLVVGDRGTVGNAITLNGRIAFDAGTPDGPPRKLVDVSRLAALNRRAATTLRHDICNTYAVDLATH